MSDPIPGGRGLSRSQKRWLLWMPFFGFEMMVYIVSKPLEGARNWGDTMVAWAVGGALYFGVWWAVSRVTGPRSGAEGSTQERLSQAGSRAALIYDRHEPRPGDEQDRSS